jgi:MarR family transcriptional regulator, negative regulator of the multidrug operon emrRAB
VSRTANLLGALALMAGDRVREAAGAEPTWSAALVSLQTMADGGSIDDLRRVLGLSHSGGVRVVKALGRAGLVELRRDPHDGRAVQVWLTEAGRQEATRIRAIRLEALDELLEPLAPADRAELDTLLARALGAATGDVDDARHICRLCDPGVCGHPARCPVTCAARAS